MLLFLLLDSFASFHIYPNILAAFDFEVWI